MPDFDTMDEGVEPTVTTADLDLDGVHETAFVDDDHDGVADAIVQVDADGNVVTSFDTDGDTSLDATTVDYHGDGTVESLYSDLDGDTVADVEQHDTDGDGVLDTTVLVDEGVVLQEDPSGFVTDVGVIDEPVVDDSEPVVDDSVVDEPLEDKAPAEQPDGSDDPIVDPIQEPTDEIADPEGSGDEIVLSDDGFYGDPDDDAKYWFWQVENGFCMPASIAQILAEAYGLESGDLMMMRTLYAAMDLGVIYGQPGAWEGVTMEGGAEMLEYFGIEAEVETGDVDDLKVYLEEDRSIILFVDADEVWYGENDTTDGGAGQDHALVITGIDESKGVVYLNDPGNPEGQMFEMPLDALDDAWEDSGRQMVVTESLVADPEVTAALQDSDQVDVGPFDLTGNADEVALEGAGGIDIHPGYVILPVVIASRLLTSSV